MPVNIEASLCLNFNLNLISHKCLKDIVVASSNRSRVPIHLRHCMGAQAGDRLHNVSACLSIVNVVPRVVQVYDLSVFLEMRIYACLDNTATPA